MLRLQKICLVWLFIFFSMVIYGSLVRAQEVAAPEPFRGAFVFVDQFQPAMVMDVHSVFAAFPAGKQKLQQLKDEGFQCHLLPRQTYRCVRHRKLEAVSKEIQRRAFRKIESHLWFDFLDVEAQVIEKVNNESYKLWLVKQPVSSEYGTYEEYEISWTPEIAKVILREDKKRGLPSLYLNVGELNDLNIQLSVTKTIDRNHFQVHLVRAQYEQGCFVGRRIRQTHSCSESDSIR